MKIVKMSLAAAVLVGASAFAIDNIKMSGDAQVFYSTSDASGQTTNVIKGSAANDSGTLFDKDSSAADAGLHLSISADLVKNDLVSVSSGASFTALSTLGLENNFVSNVWGTSHGVTTGTGASYASSPFSGAKVNNASWFNEAWVAVGAGKTTVKVGRMNLDTPLAYTETWSIESNSFEGAAIINTDLPDTTLVGAFVGNGNGTETFGQDINGSANYYKLAVAGVVNQDGTFTTYGKNGAYAAGVINNSFKPLTVQAWYYDVSKVAQAYWLQADLNMEGILAGVQYTGITLDKTLAPTNKDNDGYALMVGYEMKDTFTVKASYSAISANKSDIAVGRNTATASGASKLYTEAWWSYGYVTQADTTSYNITVEVPVKGIVDLGAYYTNANAGTNSGGTAGNDMTELTITASKSFGPLDATLAYSNIDAKNRTLYNNTVLTDKSFNQIQAYLTLNF